MNKLDLLCVLFSISSCRRVFIRQQLFQSVFQADSPLRKLFGKGWQTGERGKKVRLLGLCIRGHCIIDCSSKTVLPGLNWSKYILRRKEMNKQTCCGFCTCKKEAPHFVDKVVLYVIIYIFH